MRTVRLGDVTQVIAGQSPPSDTYNREGVGLPFFQGKVDFGTRHPVARVWCSAPERIAEPGDVLISVRAPVGPSNVANVRSCIGRGLAALRASSDLDPGYLSWFVRWQEPSLVALGQGSTFSAITRREIEDLQLPLPAIDVQRRIAAQLSKQLAVLSGASDAASERRVAVGLLRRRAQDETFAKAVTAGKTSRVLRDVLLPRNEITHPRDGPTGDAVFVGLEHIESDTGHRVGGLKIRLEDLTGRKARFHAGDIVYGYLRPYLNKVWLADSSGFCSVDQYVFKVDPSVADADYVAHFMRSSHYLSNASIKSTPGQLPRIRTEEVLEVSIPLPGLEEQRHIAAQLRRRLAAIDEMTASVRAEQEAIEALPAALLRRAFENLAA